MGNYAAKEHTDKWFFLCEYREMRDKAPEKEELAPKIAELHKRGLSPDGKFGFPVETYGGRLPTIYPVSDTREDLFAKALNNTFDVEEEVQGVDQDMRMLRKAMMEKVVTLLLRPLETGGYKLQAVLVHSDLWHGNVGIDNMTGEPVIFDALALYAHNKIETDELAAWRPKRHLIGRDYIGEYFESFDPDEPRKDFVDRNLLYCM